MQYHFKTVWHFTSPISDVWDIIFASHEWPVWWKSVKKAEIVDVTKNGIGSRVRYSFEGLLPYSLKFDMVVTDLKLYTFIEGKATGDLEGRGRWEFKKEEDGCQVTYLWNVQLHKNILKHMSSLISPIFAWNHDYVMDNGKRGIEKLLLGSRN